MPRGMIALHDRAAQTFRWILPRCSQEAVNRLRHLPRQRVHGPPHDVAEHQARQRALMLLMSMLPSRSLISEAMMATGTCPHCGRKGVHLKKCVKCGTITCGQGTKPCGNGWCPTCHGKIEPTR